MAWPAIPPDVVTWFRSAFLHANRHVSEVLLNVPNIRETSLDDALVGALIPKSAPKRLGSGAIVQMDIHNIGGLRRIYSWETADIALIVHVFRAGKPAARKIGLLQTKRLYPENRDVDDEDPVGFRYGMNAFLDQHKSVTASVLHRTYNFDRSCIYGALTAESDQLSVIENLNARFGEVVFYLLYNPPVLPAKIAYPVTSYVKIKNLTVGARVSRAAAVHGTLSSLKKGESPSFRSIASASTPRGGWPLHYWASDLLLSCKVGQEFDESNEQVIATMLERRSGPIGAAIAVTISLPE